jgi:hypothetical protein
MKAKDYIAKYGSTIIAEAETGNTKTASELISELFGEVTAISKARNCQTVEAIIAVVKEINQKYNAIQKSIPCLKPDAIKTIMVERMPELKPIWH